MVFREFSIEGREYRHDAQTAMIRHATDGIPQLRYFNKN